MTRADHVSGTDRVAEAASAENPDLVVNIQGDEPLIDPAAIDAAILPLVHDSEIEMGTLKTRIANAREITDPNVVKVVTDRHENAIYFSRSPIPFVRDGAGAGTHYKHVGLYVYQREFLLSYSALPVGPLERAERLEQLRALENGRRIRVVETEYESIGVDTPADLERVVAMFEQAEKWGREKRGPDAGGRGPGEGGSLRSRFPNKCEHSELHAPGPRPLAPGPHFSRSLTGVNRG
jgi:3-deoxy-manno-octulosonate cytidylyltransferase (CMP-KDO synthetase)